MRCLRGSFGFLCNLERSFNAKNSLLSRLATDYLTKRNHALRLNKMDYDDRTRTLNTVPGVLTLFANIWMHVSKTNLVDM